MDTKTFRRSVMERALLDDEGDAQRLVEATLATLAERITAEEAHDLAAQLPQDLQGALAGGAGERFGYDELVRRVMVRADLDPDRAGVRTAAVLDVLRDAVTPGEWEDLLAQLPGVGDPVTDVAGRPPADPVAEDVLDTIAQRPRGDRWRRIGDAPEWTADSDDGMKRGFLRGTPGTFEARVYRRPTGPTGPPLELSHGPQVFDTAAAALDYAEAQLGG